VNPASHISARPVVSREALRREADAFAAAVQPLITELSSQGMSLRRIAAELNARGVQTARGGRWNAALVRRVTLRRVLRRPS
jgi:hypothetical protein